MTGSTALPLPARGHADPHPHQLSLVWLPSAHAVHNHLPHPPAPLPDPTQASDEASPPPTALPGPGPASQAPQDSAEEGSHLLGAQPTRRQSGGAMGRAEGEGRQKGRTSFFFFLHPSQGGVSAGGGSPRGHFPGTTRAQVPSPLPQVDPAPPVPKRAPTLPRAGRQGRQVTGRGLASPFVGGPGLSCRREMAPWGSQRTRDRWGPRAWPTQHLLISGRGAWGRPASPHPCPGTAPCSEPRR